MISLKSPLRLAAIERVIGNATCNTMPGVLQAWKISVASCSQLPLASDANGKVAF